MADLSPRPTLEPLRPRRITVDVEEAEGGTRCLLQVDSQPPLTGFVEGRRACEWIDTGDDWILVDG